MKVKKHFHHMQLMTEKTNTVDLRSNCMQTLEFENIIAGKRGMTLHLPLSFLSYFLNKSQFLPFNSVNS